MGKYCIFGGGILALFVLLSLIFADFFPAVIASLADGKWWATGLLNWIVFGLAIAAFVKGSDYLEMRPYKKYTVYTGENRYSEGAKTYKLVSKDAKAIVTQSYEGWQLLKSIISPSYWITTPFYEDAIEAEWLVIDRDKRNIWIDWTKLRNSEQYDPARSKATTNGQSKSAP